MMVVGGDGGVVSYKSKEGNLKDESVVLINRN